MDSRQVNSKVQLLTNNFLSESELKLIGSLLERYPGPSAWLVRKPMSKVGAQ